MTLIKIFLILFCFIFSVSSRPSVDNHESESQVDENLRNLKSSFEQNKTEIQEQMKILELESWKFNETFENIEKALETKASELKQEEMNQKRKNLQTEFEDILTKIQESGKNLFKLSKDLDKAKVECVWENVEEEECNQKVDEHQRKIESLNDEMKISMENLAEKQKEIEEHEKLRQRSFDEFLKFTKELLESEKEAVEKVKKLEENFIQKQYELQALQRFQRSLA